MNKILQGNSLEVLKSLADRSIDCVVTSPPYFGLRDYGVSGQLGMEATHQEYISKLCDIFDEVKRVLRDDGTCFVNLGDTYNNYRVSGNKTFGNPEFNKTRPSREKTLTPSKNKQKKIPEKSLLQIPSRFAIEMSDRGWILRNEIIWHKTNALPQSVKDRFTVDFEKVFFFTKTKTYYFKQQFQPLSVATLPRYDRAFGENTKYLNNKDAGVGNLSRPKQNIKHTNGKIMAGGDGIQGHSGYFKANGKPNFYPEGRNMRTTWSIPTQSFSGGHFAVFPEKLIEPMIEAGCPPGGIVLDPFFGSGTTGLVSMKLGKNFIGIELNSEYIKIAEERISNSTLSLLVNLE